MGPASKAAVVEVLGALLEELRGVRGTLVRLNGNLEAANRLHGADLEQLNSELALVRGRVGAIEARLSSNGQAAAPNTAG